MITHEYNIYIYSHFMLITHYVTSVLDLLIRRLLSGVTLNMQRSIVTSSIKERMQGQHTICTQSAFFRKMMGRGNWVANALIR